MWTLALLSSKPIRNHESRKNYKVLFNRRNQRAGETPEMYAAELKRIYDKAYAHRASIIRQEDLLERFLMGLEDNKARVHIELSKDPETIEEAVQEVIAYIEATSYPKTEDIYHNGRNKRVRQIKRNTAFFHYLCLVDSISQTFLGISVGFHFY
jgi:hypothetical protein